MTAEYEGIAESIIKPDDETLQHQCQSSRDSDNTAKEDATHHTLKRIR